MSNNLGIMGNYHGILPFIRETAEKKGMRFDIADFPNGEVECRNQHVIAFTGRAADFINRLFECGKASIPGEKVTDVSKAFKG